MARFVVYLSTLVALCQFSVEAAPYGNLKCNLAQLAAAQGITDASAAIDGLVPTAAGNATTTATVAQAQNGIREAKAAFQAITDALSSRGDVPAATAGSPLTGLSTAQAALDLIDVTSGDAGILSRLGDARAKLAVATEASQAAAGACAGSAAAPMTSNSAAAGTSASAASSIHTPQVQRRQLLPGGLKCNLARLQIVRALSASSKAVAQLATASAADPAAAGAAQAARDGLASAGQGIGAIAAGLISGEAPPAGARTQVLDGLGAARTALAGVASTDAAVTGAVGAALGKVDASIAAGQKVLDNC